MTLEPSVFILVSIGAVACWAIGALALRANLRNLLRYKLWRQRDRLFDARMNGLLPDVPVVQEWIEIIESTIACADDLTLVKWCIAPRSANDERDRWRRVCEESLSAMTPKQRELFLNHLTELRNMVAKHLIVGSVTGWIAVLVCGIGLLLHACWKKATNPIRFVKDEAIGVIATIEQFWRFTNGSGRNGRPPISMCN